MTNSYTKFQIKSMRMLNQQRVMEAVMVMLLALFSMAVLPSLLIQYVYADQQLMEAPKALEMIPVFAYGLAVAYTIFVVVTNMGRGQKIKQLEQELYFGTSSEETTGDETVDDAELEELEKMVDEAMANKGTSRKTARKVAGKKRK